MFCPTDLYGITGWPLGHSLSPRLHNWGFGLLDLPAVFMAWPVPGSEEGSEKALEDFVRAVRVLNVRGACVTIPHKESILPLLDRVSPEAVAVGAVNTLYWDGGALCGDNTDARGFAGPLHKRVQAGQRWKKALVLGAGGAARAVLAALKELRAAGKVGEILLSNRTAARALELAGQIGVDTLNWEARGLAGADLVVNTTPMGMAGQWHKQSAFPAEAFAAGGGLAYDLVYNPLETQFLREAAAAGWDTQGGLDMFVGQGLLQFKLWTGRDLPVDGARGVLEKFLL